MFLLVLGLKFMLITLMEFVVTANQRHWGCDQATRPTGGSDEQDRID